MLIKRDVQLVPTHNQLSDRMSKKWDVYNVVEDLLIASRLYIVLLAALLRIQDIESILRKWNSVVKS